MSAGRGLRFLYGTRPGRLCLKLLTRPPVSRCAGALLSTRLSRGLIPGFIRKNRIDMGDYAPRRYRSFNDFFTRGLRPGARPVDMEPDALVSPCDSRVSVYTLDARCRLRIKGFEYSVPQLLGLDEAAGPPGFAGGTALVFRLCVDDYHRYIYFDGGLKGENVAIPGALHTVRPAALERERVLALNSRESCLLHTDGFGTVAQVEVGAMMVGRIKNLHGACRFERGQEKGMFEFGGSTVVLLFEPGRADLCPELEAARDRDLEARVLLGQRIGQRPRGGQAI